MDMPNFKDILQKLSVFKNNISLLVSVIIVLVSVLLFIPTQLMSSKLKKQVQQESIIDGGNRVKSLERTAVSRQQYEKEAERQQAHAADANEIANLALQSTQRELLSYDIFPAPDANGFSGLIFQEFGQQYCGKIDELITLVGGRDCPTDAEIERGLENSSSSGRMGGRGASMMTMTPRGYSDMDLYPGGGSMRFGNINRMIVDEMCKDRAKTISVYLNSIDILGYDYWKDYKYDVKQEEAIEDCWYHQLAYWVIEDIFATIESMNSGSDNVLTAPVKRFLGLSFTMGLKSARSSGSSGVFRSVGRRQTQGQKADTDRPVYVRDTQDALTKSCTGRLCGEDIDIIHFNFSVIVGTKSVLPFMKELCSVKEHQFRGYPDPNQPVKTFQPAQTFKHNQITILESKIGSIDLNNMNHRYYRYGDENVVSLDLICEYLFNVSSYDKLVPQPVLDTLQGLDDEDN
ncbi:MAG: hypothetical protein ACYSUX_09655 [Planctomycetota bacterium]|jgi:hypothetical protein